MSQILSKLQEFLQNNKTLAIAAGSILLLTATKLYCRGGVCKVDGDLLGKVIVVTGGNSGIGKETVQALSSKGCTIIFGARDRVKSQQFIKSLMNKNKDCKVIYFPLDLGDKLSIEEFSLRVIENCEKIDILINNAGIVKYTRGVTKDDFEMTMGVNHLGHFYLTYHLWKLLRAADNPRIITVSSNAHQGVGLFRYNAAIDFDDFHFMYNYKWDIAYTRSKIANILFTRQLQYKMNQKGINGTAVSLHPGVIPTDIFRDFGLSSKILKVLFSPFLYLFFKTPWQGAQTTLYLALEDDNKLQKGEFYKDCKRCSTSQFSSNRHNAERLWRISQEQLGIKFAL